MTVRLSRAKKVLQQLAIAPVMALCKQLSSLGPHKYDALVYADRAREIDKALSGRSHSLQWASPSVTKLYLAFLEAGFVYTNCVSGCLGMGWGYRAINRHSTDNMDARSMWNDRFHRTVPLKKKPQNVFPSTVFCHSSTWVTKYCRGKSYLRICHENYHFTWILHPCCLQNVCL